MENKRAQIWGFDLMIAMVIFISGILAFYIYSINYPSEGQDKIDSLSYEGEIIGENLLTSGYPSNWSDDNVAVIGIVDENRINATKLEQFYNLANDPDGYDLSRDIFNTKYEYFINFSKEIGFNGIGLEFSNPVNLVRISRITIYENQTITMDIYIWES